MQTLLDVTLLSCWVVVVFTSSRTSARPDGRRYMHTDTQRGADLTHLHDNTVDLYSRHDHFKRKTCYSCFLAWSCAAGGPLKVGNSNPTIPTTACHAWRLRTENHMDQFHNNWADLIQHHSKASCHSWISFLPFSIKSWQVDPKNVGIFRSHQIFWISWEMVPWKSSDLL